MTVKLDAHRLLYVSIPKCASTSLKYMFYAIEHGRDFVPREVKGKKREQIHTLYPARPRAALIDSRITGYFKFTVVRDPIKRFISAYVNKVVAKQCLEKGGSPTVLADAGLPTHPDLWTFIEHLEVYQAANLTILGHTRPAIDFIGPDPLFFDKIYNLSELPVLVADLEVRLKTRLSLDRHQTSKNLWGPDDLTAQQRGKLLSYYAADYAAYADFF